MKPLVSIIMPTFNRVHYLPDAIRSILASDYKNFELIIVDDGSTDSTPVLMDYYTKKDSRIKYFYRKENKGISYTRNEGISKSHGEYIAVADSDDIYYAGRLKIALKTLAKGDSDIFYSSYYRGNEAMQIIDGVIPAKHFSKEKTTVKEILATQVIPHVTIVAKRKCFVEHPYRNALKVNDDLALVLDWWRAGYKFCMSIHPLVLVRYHDQSTSSTRDTEVKKITEQLRAEFDDQT